MYDLSNCRLCPRACGVNRSAGEKGVCGETHAVRLARAALHAWEEPCISGTQGSGTVFFSGCTLRCVYCQNREISTGSSGKPVSVARLAEIFLELEAEGAANINLVTPTHFAPQIIEAVAAARKQGMALPIVYNTSGYETVETIESLANTVDIYLTDFKYYGSALSKRYSGAADYFEQAERALAHMVAQKPLRWNGELLRQGVLVRHLLLPGQANDSKRVLFYLHTTYGSSILLSIMRQFTPYKIGSAFSELNRKVTDAEYDELLDYALEIGIENAFIQEAETAEESFIPPFDFEGI